MIGAIAGDIIGSVFEHEPIKTTQFQLFTDSSRFTDDTVLSVAIADAILNQADYGTALKNYGRKYPAAGYGMSFLRWIQSSVAKPYNSWGNGSAMRVSPVGFAFDSTEDILREAEKSAAVTHDHPEGIKGAQATALAIFLARKGADKSEIRRQIQHRFQYNLDRSTDDVRPYYVFNCSYRNPQFSHFRVPVEKGRDIVESMYGNITGDAIPRYIATAGGKIPLHRDNVINRDGTDLILKKPWNDEEVKYPDADPEKYANPNFSFVR